MTDSITFDVSDLIEIPVSVNGKDYILREANGNASTKYNNALTTSFTLGSDGKPVKIVGLASIEPLLISLCLFPIDANGTVSPQHVKESVIREWPARILSKLYAKSKEISELDKPEDDDKKEDDNTVKNEESDTTDGSD